MHETCMVKTEKHALAKHVFESKNMHKTCIIATVGMYTAGLLISYTHTNNQFAKQPEGLRQFRDHRWKALGEDNPDLRGIFFCDHFLASHFLNK